MEDMLEMLEEQLIERNVAHFQLPLLVEVQILRQDDDVVVLQLSVDLLDALYAHSEDVTYDMQLLLARAQLKSCKEGLEREGGVVALVQKQDFVIFEDDMGERNEDC